jgi:hypothetical protein
VSTISLLLDMFETSGLLSSTIETFRLSEPSTWTLEQFKQEINHGNAKRLCRLTTGVAGYHGALVATAPTAAVARVAKPCHPDSTIMCNGIHLYYCWSHGLSGYVNHISKTCVNRIARHIATHPYPWAEAPKAPTARNMRRALAAHMVNDTSDNDI